MFRCLLLTIAICCSLVAYSQEEFVQPESKLITKLPFSQLSGGIIIIKAKFDQIPDSLNFILDTGSGGISLDSSTTALLQIPLIKTEKTIRGIAGLKKVDFAMDHSLHFLGLTVDHLDFHINDYDLLTSVYGVRIDGIIGYSFLRRFIVRLDYDNNKVEIYTPGTYKYPRGGQLLKPNFTTLPQQLAIIQDSREILNRFIFDTGAGLCFLLSKDFTEDSSFFKTNRRFFTTQAEGLGGKKQMELTVVKSVKIGQFKFKNVPVHVFDDTYNVTNYPVLGGILGNDLLRRFNVILNYPNNQYILNPILISMKILTIAIQD